MNTRTEKERYAAWVRAVNHCAEHDWRCISGWIFRAPSGTTHDLSAADLTKLDMIESRGLFRVYLQEI